MQHAVLDGMCCIRHLLSVAAILVVGLASGRAEACELVVGVPWAYPSGSVLAANDSIVLPLQLAEASELLLDATVDGEPVAVETTTILDGSSWWGTSSLVRVDFVDGLLVQGATIELSVSVPRASNGSLDVAYTVGSADNSELLQRWEEVSLSMEFQPQPSESCGVENLYRLEAAPTDEVVASHQGERSRFVELVVYLQDEPGETVATSVSSAERTATITSFVQGPEVAELCVRVSVTDASGVRETVLDACDLCERFPELCDPVDDGCACSADRRGGPWRAVGMLLGVVGLVAARTRRGSTE